MSSVVAQLPRVRQVVLVAAELDPVVARLRDELELGEPFADPGVGHFGLRNAVFALGGTFLEVVSPVQEDTSAGRVLSRRGGDCGYMVMFQVQDLVAARERIGAQQVREVFEVDLDDISEVHLHPGDMRGAIVSLSSPRPPESWRWGGPGWSARAVPQRIVHARVTAPDPAATAQRWSAVLGVPVASAGVELAADDGRWEVVIAGEGRRVGDTVEIGGARFSFVDSEEERWVT